MPWLVKDVESHKKGLSSEQKKEWVKVANGVLADCIKKGGTDKECSPKAIRIANSKFEEDSVKAPKTAMSFTDTEAFAKTDSEGNVYILAYSGKTIKNHWWWGDLAIDVNGVEFNKKFYPILEQHDLLRKVGFSAKPSIENNQLIIKNITFMDNQISQEFQDNSKKGFPYEASISVRPSIIERVVDGETSEVNGFKMKGPATIFRKWEYKETSVCVFGADPNTKSKVFSDDELVDVPLQKEEYDETLFVEEEENNNGKESEEVKKVKLEDLKKDSPEEFAVLLQEAKESLEPVLRETIKKEVEVPLTAKLTELSTTVTSQAEKILSFEKTELMRVEKERKEKANSIWLFKLSLSDIPEHLFSKVKEHVSYTKFISSEGSLDEMAFASAIDAEIKDWESIGINKTVIVGQSFTQKELDSQTARLTEDSNWVKEMAKLAGQTIQ